MRQVFLCFASGILLSALPASGIAVYVLHDVDADLGLREAFIGLVSESIVFTLIIAGSVSILFLLARRFLHLRDGYPRKALSFCLGIGVTAFQYAWDVVGRLTFPGSAQTSLGMYLVLATCASSSILLLDTAIQLKSNKGHV